MLRQSILFFGIPSLPLLGCEVKPDAADTGSAVEAIDADGDGAAEDTDCDDTDPAVFPGADEICDGIDNDCDGTVDTDPVVGGFVFKDADGDGFGDPNEERIACTPSPGEVEDNTDCDDTRDTVHANADEMCDEIDNDCDGFIDEDSATDARIWYADLDQDGFGDADNYQVSCTMPALHLEDGTDCDDQLDTVFPGALERCDALDSDCNGVIGEIMVPDDYGTLQEAIDAGEAEICVAPGVYFENIDFNGAVGITVEGAGGPASVTIDGDGIAPVMMMNNGEADITLIGLTLANGYTNTNLSAGLYAEKVANLTVMNVIFEGHVCEGGCLGAALGVRNSQHPQLMDVEVKNTTLLGGSGNESGGMVGILENSVSIDGLSIHNNRIEAPRQNFYGTGLTVWGNLGQAFLNDIRIQDNYVDAKRMYGSLNLTILSHVEMANIEISGNYFSLQDFAYGTLNTLNVNDLWSSNVSIVGNEIYSPDGAIEAAGLSTVVNDVTAINNLIVAGNTTTARVLFSSGVRLVWGEYTVENVTIHGNQADVTTPTNIGGAFDCLAGWIVATNVTLTDNQVSGAADLEGWSHGPGWEVCQWDVRYSNVYNNGTNFEEGLTDWTGENGNISVFPDFADVSSEDPTEWNLRLRARSPLVDAGDPERFDMDRTISDMGAYGGLKGESW